MNKPWHSAVLIGTALACCHCFGMIRDPVRRFYVLHVPPQQVQQAQLPPVDALIRVRDLDCESAYDKFQMVVRRSPFELVYRQKDVWAVKPGRMVSDLLARALQERGGFAGVTRELGERRPDFLLSGDLHVLELEQDQPLWQAHIALSLQVSDVDSGDILWSGHFEEREPCPSHDYALAVESISTGLGRIIRQALRDFSVAQPLPSDLHNAHAAPEHLLPLRPTPAHAGDGIVRPAEQVHPSGTAVPPGEPAAPPQAHPAP